RPQTRRRHRLVRSLSAAGVAHLVREDRFARGRKFWHAHEIVSVGAADDEHRHYLLGSGHFSPLAMDRPPKDRCMMNISTAGIRDRMTAPAKCCPKLEVCSPNACDSATGAT